MTVIGIHGPSGAGKGELASYLSEKYHVHVIDADEVYKKLLVPPSKCLDELESVFGRSILLPDGSLNRVVLGHTVFCNPEKLEILNSISHKYIVAKIRDIIRTFADIGADICAIDAPLLCESGLDRDCDIIVAVISDKEVRIERIMKRDNITRARACERIEAQKPDEFYIRRSTHILYNNGTSEALFADADTIMAKLARREVN